MQGIESAGGESRGGPSEGFRGCNCGESGGANQVCLRAGDTGGEQTSSSSVSGAVESSSTTQGCQAGSRSSSGRCRRRLGKFRRRDLGTWYAQPAQRSACQRAGRSSATSRVDVVGGPR